jgi:anti-sigma B factor antagonist
MLLECNRTNDIVQATILTKEASVANAEPFKEEMIKLVDEAPRIIILSFQNIRYVDSSFLGSLVASLKYAIPRGVDIYLVELDKDVHNLLALIRMDKVFKIYKSFQQAMDTVQ